MRGPFFGPGAAVLEIGCGTGQLTRSLLARGLRVTAVEPGQQLIVRARDQLNGVGDVQFVNARLEDASLPRAHYSAVFSASAIHWIDPDLSWRKAADALVDGGSLALLSYFGLDDSRSADDQQALRAAITTIAPELAADWPTYRDLAGTLAGVATRRENLSEAWAWLGGYEIARGYAADLFADAQIVALPTLLKHTADELNGLLGTMSFWARTVAPTARRSRRRKPILPPAARTADPLQHSRLPGIRTAPAPHLNSWTRGLWLRGCFALTTNSPATRGAVPRCR